MKADQEKYRVQSYGKVIKVTKEMMIDDNLESDKTLSQALNNLYKNVVNFKIVILQANKWWLLPIVNYLSRRLK